MRYLMVGVVFLLVGIGAGALLERSRAGAVETGSAGDGAVEAGNSDIMELLSVYGTIRGDGRTQSQEACAMLAISVIQRRSNEAVSRDFGVSQGRARYLVRAEGAEQWVESAALPTVGRDAGRFAPPLDLSVWKWALGAEPAAAPGECD
jgi:hypothetical protein